MNLTTMGAIVKRDLKSYFGSITGYVFVLAFVGATFLGAFGSETFIPANKANLDLLTAWMPSLLALFIPAIAMATWAEERKQGTDQLLLTLPAHDYEVVLAKYGARLGIYTIALAFTLTHWAILAWLGDPDPGLMVATYASYWLMGAAGIAVAMLASAITSNLTVAWLLGLLFFVVLLRGPDGLDQVSDAGFAESLGTFGLLERSRSLARGILDLQDLFYFAAVIAGGLYANAIMLGRRHWTMARERLVHGIVRLTAIAVAGVSLVVLGGRFVARADITVDGMLSLAPEAREVLDGLETSRPVYIQAWISPTVPEEYRATREALVLMLEEFDARGGDALQVAIHDTELYSEEAARAERSFGIKPQTVTSVSEGRQASVDIFMGLAVTCGTRELKIPFFDRGLPVQYELTRAIGAVADVERAKVGVLASGASLFGGFDFQSMRRSEDWELLKDLGKQYEVTKVEGTAAIDTSLDVLVVPMPSSLGQEKIDRLAEYLHGGGKALLLCDPYPEFNLDLGPLRPPPRPGGNNPFNQMRGPPPEPKGNLDPLLAAMGLRWKKDRVVWDDYNPHPEWQDIPRELVFVAPGAAGADAWGFNPKDPVTSGLQEVVLIFPGELEDVSGAEIEVTPLLKTTPVSGFNVWGDMIEESFFGIMPKDPRLRYYESQGKQRVLAARVKGKLPALKDGEGVKKGQPAEKPFEAIVVTDMDMVSDVFYDLRRRGALGLQLDNVTFVANCIDALAGEEAYLELRKRRPRHRTLTYFEQTEQLLREREREVAAEARKQSEERLKEARERLEAKVKAIEEREDLDFRTKRIMLEGVREAEQRKLDLQEHTIKEQERAAVRLGKQETKQQRDLRALSARAVGGALSILPALLLGVLVLVRKVRLERAGIEDARRRVK